MVDTRILSNNISQEQMFALVEKILLAGNNNDLRMVQELMDESLLFSSAEREKFITILDEERQSGHSTFLDSLWQIDFERKPVSFKEWVEDPYYMGSLGTDLYPKWKEELEYILHPKSGIVKWGITGSIGSGKTFCALVATLYKGPYYCSCLRDPQKYFHIASDSEIIFGLFNAVIDNAVLINFNQIARFIKASKYFRDHCPPVIRPSKAQIYWPSKEMILRVGSSDLHVLGSNMFSYIMDEANFMHVKKKKGGERDVNSDQAYKIYNSASRRMTSRFDKYGINPGLAILVSSRLHQSSFLENLMEKGKNDPTFHVSDYALWETVGREKYSPNTFRVLIGDENHNSEILDEVDTSSPSKWNWKIIPDKAKKAPLGMNYIDIPTNFYFEFCDDTEGALRDIAGIPTFGVRRLIQRVESIRECIDHSRQHPFLSMSHELSMDNPESDLLQCVKWELITDIVDGVRVPKYHSWAPRFIHCDLGLSGDAAGISMCCPFSLTTKTQYDVMTGQVTESFQPKVWVDFMLQIVPVRGEQIDLTKIVAFILNLKNYGFSLQRVSFDGFASEMAIQIVKKAGAIPDRRRASVKGRFDDRLDIESSLLSVDKNDTPYRMLRDALNQGTLSYYDYPIVREELLGLEHDIEARKVTHNENISSKDISDSLAGSVYGVLTAKASTVNQPADEVGSLNKPMLDQQVIKGIVDDYPDRDHVTNIVPHPTGGFKPNRLKTGRSDWAAQIENFGVKRKF